MDRFELAHREFAILGHIRLLEAELNTVRAEQAKDLVLGAPMKWIEVHSLRTGGVLKIRETLPLHPEPIITRVGVLHIEYRPQPVEVTVHLSPQKAKKVYEVFRGKGAEPLFIAGGVAAHAPWSPKLEAMLRAI